MKKEIRTKFNTRQHMVAKNFEVFYYSDTQMKPVEYHSHDYYEFYVFLGGNVTISIEGNEEILTPGDIILIPPHTKHHPIIKDNAIPYQRFIFWMSQSFANELLQNSTDYGYVMQHTRVTKHYIYHLDLFSFNSIQSKLINLLEEIHSDRFGKDTKINIAVHDLVLSLNRNIYELENPAIEKEEKNLYKNLLLYVEDHIDEELTLDALANEFYVSKYHIAHVFKDHLGLSLHQYIIKKRLDLSRSAILSGTDITTAYIQCGFNDYSSYFRAFKKEYGMSPKEYKLSHQADFKSAPDLL